MTGDIYKQKTRRNTKQKGRKEEEEKRWRYKIIERREETD